MNLQGRNLNLDMQGRDVDWRKGVRLEFFWLSGNVGNGVWPLILNNHGPAAYCDEGLDELGLLNSLGR